MRDKTQKIVNKSVQIMSSKYFLSGIIVLFVIQALWIALSFRYPMLYDEAFHIDAIKLFSKQLSPFIINQPTSYDIYGNLSNGDATLYHYLLSFPYRFIELFTSSSEFLVIFMRIINILFVASGLYFFYRLFKKLDINKSLINVSILMFTLLPIVPFVAATTNYDNLLFLLTPLYLIICVNIIQSKKIQSYQYVALITIGCFTSLVKFTFLPIFLISFVYLAILAYKSHKKSFISKFWRSLRSAPKSVFFSALAIAAIMIGLFYNSYIIDIIKYGTPQPSCTQTMAADRCALSGISERARVALETKGKRPLQSPSDYTEGWFNGMVVLTSMSGTRTSTGDTVFSTPLPIMQFLVFFGSFVTGGILLYVWRSIARGQSWYFLSTVSLSLVIILFFYNYSSYIKYHQSFAVQPRYLLSILPILFLMFVVAINFTLRKYRSLKLILLVITLTLFTQGGGVITHILKSNDSWDWNNKIVRQVNDDARNILKPLIKEN